MICALCNQHLNTNGSIYKGFDTTFCSEYCRQITINNLYKKDMEINNNEWLDRNRIDKDLYIWTPQPMIKKKSVNNINELDNPKKEIILKLNNEDFSNIRKNRTCFAFENNNKIFTNVSKYFKDTYDLTVTYFK